MLILNRFLKKNFEKFVKFFFNVDIIFVVVFYKNINKSLKTHLNREKINFVKYKKYIAQF